MALNTVISKGVATAFKVLRSLSHPAQLIVRVEDGFADTVTYHQIKQIIIDSFSERDVQFLSFSELIQPQDVKGIIQSSEIPGIFPSSKDDIEVLDESVYKGKYSIIANDTDPANAAYTLLLRRV